MYFGINKRGCGKSRKMTIFWTCLVVGDKRVCVFCFAKALRTSWICFMLTECRFRYYVPVNAICSLPEFRFAEMSCFATPASASSIRPQIRSADNPLFKSDLRCVKVRLFQFTFKLVMIFPNQSIYPCGIARSLLHFTSKSVVISTSQNIYPWNRSP